MVSAVAALVWANSPWGHRYHDLWHAKVSVGVGGSAHAMSVEHWVNDGLMAVFFLLVGLEIKRELLVGELASVRRASLPVAAAIGGRVAPALIYAALNAGGQGAAGWGVPMATDIAFAVGVLVLVGRAVPTSVKVFLLAIAIVDDLGAVLVIALFYTSGVLLAFAIPATFAGSGSRCRCSSETSRSAGATTSSRRPRSASCSRRSRPAWRAGRSSRSPESVGRANPEYP